jgi:hypothetical protein
MTKLLHRLMKRSHTVTLQSKNSKIPYLYHRFIVLSIYFYKKTYRPIPLRDSISRAIAIISAGGDDITM